LASSAVPFGALARTDQWPSTGGESSSGRGGVAPPAGVKNRRVMEAFDVRVAEAIRDASVPAATNINNGDEARYADKGGAYTKGLPHDSFGRVNLNAYQSLKTTLNSSEFADFRNIIMGGARTLNGRKEDYASA
jgi:hypothetical protein